MGAVEEKKHPLYNEEICKQEKGCLFNREPERRHPDRVRGRDRPDSGPYGDSVGDPQIERGHGRADQHGRPKRPERFSVV